MGRAGARRAPTGSRRPVGEPGFGHAGPGRRPNDHHHHHPSIHPSIHLATSASFCLGLLKRPCDQSKWPQTHMMVKTQRSQGEAQNGRWHKTTNNTPPKHPTSDSQGFHDVLLKHRPQERAPSLPPTLVLIPRSQIFLSDRYCTSEFCKGKKINQALENSTFSKVHQWVY